jgi:hypothetical protein
MSEKMIRWCCNGCPQSEPCLSSGARKPWRCPYGTDENMLWVKLPRPLKREERRKTTSNMPTTPCSHINHRHDLGSVICADCGVVLEL